MGREKKTVHRHTEISDRHKAICYDTMRSNSLCLVNGQRLMLRDTEIKRIKTIHIEWNQKWRK